MRKILFLTFLSISLSFAGMNKAHAVDPKGKAFAIICAYGTVGGALLGFASMAFGANSRAIAQGASLGLYAGIGFGAYVISSYADPNSPMNDPYAPQSEPPPGFDPYAPAPGGFSQPGYPADDRGGFGAPQEDQGGFFSQRINQFDDFKYKTKKGKLNSLPIYIPVLNMNF